jgi:hypothetical protein
MRNFAYSPFLVIRYHPDTPKNLVNTAHEHADNATDTPYTGHGR